MNLPKLLTDNPLTMVFDGQSWINPIRGIHTEIKDNQLNITFSKLKNPGEAISIIISGSKKYSSIVFEANKGSQTKVNLFFVLKNHSNNEIVYHIKDQGSLDINEFFYGKIKDHGNLNKNIKLKNQSSLSINSGFFIDGNLDVNESVLLLGAESVYQGENLVIGHETDIIQVRQNVRHRAVKSLSNIQNAIVANDASRIKFDIYGTIDKTMEKSQCFQHSKGILLGEKSWIEVDPKLIINEFDVEAGHGAAIGQINQDEVYYLLSRGLTETLAKRLIIQGYTDPFIARYLNSNHSKYVRQTLLRKMGGF